MNKNLVVLSSVLVLHGFCIGSDQVLNVSFRKDTFDSAVGIQSNSPNRWNEESRSKSVSPLDPIVTGVAALSTSLRRSESPLLRSFCSSNRNSPIGEEEESVIFEGRDTWQEGSKSYTLSTYEKKGKESRAFILKEYDSRMQLQSTYTILEKSEDGNFRRIDSEVYYTYTDAKNQLVDLLNGKKNNRDEELVVFKKVA